MNFYLLIFQSKDFLIQMIQCTVDVKNRSSAQVTEYKHNVKEY